MNLHPSIRAYFDADKSLEGGAPLHVFAPDAVIEDDGHTHAGHDAIDAWWRDAKAKYQAVAKPVEVDASGEAIEVRADVAGQFRGSPITLTFAFHIKDGRIAALRIGS